jgi:hypothetical protein
MLARLAIQAFADPQELMAQLTALANRPDCVEPWRRAMLTLFYATARTSVRFVGFWEDTHAHPLASAVVVLLSTLFVVCAVYAVLNPERGWQNRLAGMWLVPR